MRRCDGRYADGAVHMEGLMHMDNAMRLNAQCGRMRALTGIGTIGMQFATEEEQ